MGVVVNVYKEDNAYYLHEVLLQNKEGDALFKTGLTTKGITSKVSPSLLSLLQKVRDVNSAVKLSSRDASYLKAVEDGDMETAQRMVDEAAKAAGYTMPLYHGAKKGDGREDAVVERPA